VFHVLCLQFSKLLTDFLFDFDEFLFFLYCFVKMDKPLHVETPLIYSNPLSKTLGRDVFLKLENLQPGGSFKIRGIGHTMQEAVKNGKTLFIGSSGGNAGMAMAVAANKMGTNLKLFIPKSTLPFMVEKLKSEGVDVIVTGENWNEANVAAEKELESQPNAFMVHPFGQETTWKGHSSLVNELRSQLPDSQVPCCIATCVGGGGLALGILQGLDKSESHGWSKVPVVAMETHGANCLSAARTAGKSVTLPAITSIATSLGALKVADDLLKCCLDQPDRVISKEVSDGEAMEACVRFANDHRILVEPACGSVLASVYSGHLTRILPDLGPGPVVVIVCGGNIVNTQLLNQWSQSINN